MVALPALLASSTLLSLGFWQFVLITAGIYTVFSLGLQLQFGHTGLLNFGHIAFMAIGAYTMAILVQQHDVPMWAAALIAMTIAMVFGLIVGLPALRLRADYLAITTIAFGEIIRIMIITQQDLTGGPLGLFGAWTDFTAFAGRFGGRLESLTGFTWDKDRVLLLMVWLTVLVLYLVLQRLVKSPWGRVLRAIREDEDAANALGKNVFAYKLQVMAIGSAIAAIAGFFFSYQILFLNPASFEPIFTFFAWVIVLMGGTGRNAGVPLGAIIFAFIFAGTRFFGFWPLSLLDEAQRAALRLMIIGLILIGIMAFRPQGLFGKKEELFLER